MKKKVVLAVCAWLAVAHSAHLVHSRIVESDDIQDVLEYIDDQTLLIFDIDNTLATMPMHIGSDIWFYRTLQQMMREGKTKDQALKELLPLTSDIHKAFWLIPVQECASCLIQNLQAKNMKVIALTYRSSTIVERTIEQLRHIGIDLQTSSLTDEAFEFTFDRDDQYKTVTHKNGIIFCGKNDKGDVLMHIFTHLHYFPKKVVFVDDKRSYLEAVQEAMERLGIEFIGIRYGACDGQIREYDPAKAEQELQEFLALQSCINPALTT